MLKGLIPQEAPGVCFSAPQPGFRLLTHTKVVVEARASYPWFVELVEPMADEIILAKSRLCFAFCTATLDVPITDH